jgi:membrane protease YdiL (CAAX protease family)
MSHLPLKSQALAVDPWRRCRQWLEVMLLFVVPPVVIASAQATRVLGPALAAMVLLGITLLWTTPGFRWRSLVRGGLAGNWPLILAFSVITALIATTLVLWLHPDNFLFLPRNKPALWALVLVLYPVLSAVPQELFFRVLFFERYGSLFPTAWSAVVCNAACFGLAHLFYANWPAVVLSTLGGAVFAWAYLEKRSFALAAVLHTLGGLIIFTSGMGFYFYTGAIGHV